MDENNSEEGGILVIGFAFIAFVIILVLVIFFITKRVKSRESRESTQEPVSDTPPSGHGGRTPGVPQTITPTETPPSGDEITDVLNQIKSALVSLLTSGLAGIAVTAAAEAIIKSTWRQLGSTLKSAMKTRLRVNTQFLRNLRPKVSPRATALMASKFFKANIARAGFQGLVHLGVLYAKSLKALGHTSAEISTKLVTRFGPRIGTEAATQLAAKVATEAATPTGGFVLVELAFAGIGMWADITDSSGYMQIDAQQTSDLLVARSKYETEQRNAYIQGPKDDNGNVNSSLAAGFYPLYWGPLDEINQDVNDEGVDAVEIMIEEKMFDLLFADDPDPFMVKLLYNMARRYQLDSSADVQSLINVTMLNDLDDNDYWGLYDKAFEQVCVTQGGAVVNTGFSSKPKMCSHTSEANCHAKSPWTEGVGPVVSDDTDAVYTEWRDSAFFNKNYAPAQAPQGTSGVCILQSPAFHQTCTKEPLCTAAGCARNEYIRNRGICVNSRDVCSKSGVSYCANMSQMPGTPGDNCQTGLGGEKASLGPSSQILLPGEGLPSCYKSTGQQWGELLNPLGSTVYRYFASGQFARDTIQTITNKPPNSYYKGPGLVPLVNSQLQQYCPDSHPIKKDIGIGSYCYSYCNTGEKRGGQYFGNFDYCSPLDGAPCLKSEACPQDTNGCQYDSYSQTCYNTGDTCGYTDNTLSFTATRLKGTAQACPTSGNLGECYIGTGCGCIDDNGNPVACPSQAQQEAADYYQGGGYDPGMGVFQGGLYD